MICFASSSDLAHCLLWTRLQHPAVLGRAQARREVVGRRLADGPRPGQWSCVRDPCAKGMAIAVLAWHGLAVNVLVEGIRDRIRRLEKRQIYLRIVEVAGSSPVTSRPL